MLRTAVDLTPTESRAQYNPKMMLENIRLQSEQALNQKKLTLAQYRTLVKHCELLSRAVVLNLPFSWLLQTRKRSTSTHICGPKRSDFSSVCASSFSNNPTDSVTSLCNSPNTNVLQHKRSPSCPTVQRR